MTSQHKPTASRRNTSGLARDIEVLEALGLPEAVQAGGLGVVRIAEITGREKTVISRTLATLADAGVLARNAETLSYRLGPRLFALAARTAESTLVAEARPYLRRIARHTGETSHLSVLRGGNVLTLVSELSPHQFRTAGWEGVTTAAWRTPSGRVLLSDWDDEDLAAWYAQHGQDRPTVGPGRSDVSGSRFAVLDTPSEGSAQVRSLDDLRAQIARIRETGYAISDEELEVGVVAASAPVTDFTGRIIAAVNVSAPKARIPGRLDALGQFVAKAARPLSAHLGGA
ncbi:MAG TPA: IclR family transcriptional regulator [Intrasporangium sp.]|uniref:IclR family transcriptional regulator n=1 Tax=Intrasporangium sp. TaxID=1925024 RepID=UPI002D76813B|nr:IclR family transcriptional regulator [Intrasporangium sp.]HET7397065.1 IclR family transcriptional regulator [Intrasporangium sp.]